MNNVNLLSCVTYKCTRTRIVTNRCFAIINKTTLCMNENTQLQSSLVMSPMGSGAVNSSTAPLLILYFRNIVKAPPAFICVLL